MLAILRNRGNQQKIVRAKRALNEPGFYGNFFIRTVRSHNAGFASEVLAPFLFLIVINHIERHTKGNTGYLTNTGRPAKDNTSPQRVQLIAK